MENEFKLPFLRVLWKLLVLAMFPVILIVYCKLWGFSFATVDQGTNYHKWVIFCLYTLVVLLWCWLNPRVNRLLSRG